MRQRTMCGLLILATLGTACRRQEAPVGVGEQTADPVPASQGGPDASIGRVPAEVDSRLGPRPGDPFDHVDAAVTPTVHVGNMSVTGGLDVPTVRQVLNLHATVFATCGSPRLGGAALSRWMVGLHFEIGADGTVRTASRGASRPPDAEFTDCLTLVCRGLEFPRPDGGASVTVDVTLGSVTR